jgi:hypothetical protein
LIGKAVALARSGTRRWGEGLPVQTAVRGPRGTGVWLPRPWCAGRHNAVGVLMARAGIQGLANWPRGVSRARTPLLTRRCPPAVGGLSDTMFLTGAVHERFPRTSV